MLALGKKRNQLAAQSNLTQGVLHRLLGVVAQESSRFSTHSGSSSPITSNLYQLYQAMTVAVPDG